MPRRMSTPTEIRWAVLPRLARYAVQHPDEIRSSTAKPHLACTLERSGNVGPTTIFRMDVALLGQIRILNRVQVC